MPRSSSEKSEETRARIIDAAYHLFIEFGYNATSMRMISQNAGVTVGAIYNHFATKEALWVEVIQIHHPYHQLFPALKAAHGETIVEMIHSAAKGVISELLQRPDLPNLIFIEIVEFKSRHIPGIYQSILPELFQVGNIFQGERDRLRNIPIDILLRSLAGLVFSYYLTSFLPDTLEGIRTDETSLNQMLKLYLFGILADDDPARVEEARNGQHGSTRSPSMGEP